MPIQRESFVDIAIKRIKDHIAESGLKPHDKYLSEKELINQLQVSRTVIREALISLQAVGIVTIKPGGGVYIGNPNFDTIKVILKHHYDTHGVQLKELIEIRKIIELGALRLIIEKKVDVDFTKLEEINESYYHAITKKQDTRDDDRLFHQYLIKATENETFYNFSEVIHDYFSLTKIDLILNKEKLIQSYHQHTEMIDALKEKDLSKAHHGMTLHFEPLFAFINQMEENSKDGAN